MFWARLSDVVAAIEPHIDTSFIAGECLARVRSIADRFPSHASNFFGFERRLGRGDPRIDFALGLSGQGASWIASERMWPGVAAIFDRWPGHVASGNVRPWLEFDTSRPIDPNASPIVYIGLDPRDSDIASTVALARCLDDRPPLSLDTVARCLQRFPKSVARVYIGSMKSRNVNGLRLSIEAMPLGELSSYLRDIGWPGNRTAVEAFLRRFDPLCELFCPQLDVRGELQPELGVELLPAPADSAEDANAPVIRLLRRFVEDRLCSETECAELERWPSRRSYAVPLVDQLIEAAHPHPNGRLFHGSLICALHHVKLAFGSDGSVHAKAYFGVILRDRRE